MARYYRIIAWQPGPAADMTIGTMHLLDASGERVDAGATITSSVPPSSGALSALGDATPGSGVTFSAASAGSPGFRIVFDCGTNVTAATLRVGAAIGSDAAAWPVAYAVETSSDGNQWSHVAFVSERLAVLWPGAGNTTMLPLWMLNGISPVTLLMPCNTAAAQDISGYSSPVLVGGAALSAVQSASGGYSYRIPGEGSIIHVPVTSAGSPLLFHGNDFTISFKVWLDNATGHLCTWGGALNVSWSDIALLASPGAGGQWRLTLTLRSSSNFGAPDIQYYVTGWQDFPVQQWCRVELRRSGSTFTTWVNGVVERTVIDGRPLMGTPNAAGVCFGGAGFSDTGRPAECINGYVDDIVVVNGAAIAVPDTLPGSLAALTSRAPRVLHSRSIVAASMPLVAHSMRASRVQMARDIEFGGTGRIFGTTKSKANPSNLPTKARVVLLHQRSKLLVRETWSDPLTGDFMFDGLDVQQEFLALAEDAGGNFAAVAAQRLVPEAIP